MLKLEEINNECFKKIVSNFQRFKKKEKKVFKEISGVPIVLLQVEILELH